jgi:hypothetical protein
MEVDKIIEFKDGQIKALKKKLEIAMEALGDIHYKGVPCHSEIAKQALKEISEVK